MTTITGENTVYLLQLAGIALTGVVCVKLRPWRWVAVWWRSRG